MKNILALILATGLLVATTACETSTSETPLTPDPGASDPLGSWALQSFELNGGSVVPVPEPVNYTLELSDDGRAHVRADCNVCTGGYELSGSALTFGLMACTRAACQPGSLEHDYLEALGSSSTFERTGDMLTLAYADGVLRLQAQ